jgi:hypothetical protein
MCSTRQRPEVRRARVPADAVRVIARALKGAPADCNPSSCEHKPDAFSLDTDGIAFRPTTYCSLQCGDEHRPRIRWTR